jgi:mxaA protein
MKPSSNQHSLAAALFALFFSLSLIPAALADEPVETVKDGVVTLLEKNPDRSVGYTVGDILERTITLDVKKPYKLLETSLPIVGYERRYKGQIIGIELRSISHTQKEHDASTTYTIHLAYQVFTNNVVAKPAALPAEIVRLIANGRVAQYRIPSWLFAISPIATYGDVNIQYDMSKFRGPLLLDAGPDKLRLKVLVSIFAVSLLGLLYILGRRAWLPRMGGPFARAYRDINKLRKLPVTDTSLQTAVSRVHQSLNVTAGNSVFNDTLEAFLVKKPAFMPVKADIEQFFGLSRSVFFEHKAAHQAGESPMLWLREFCRRCRDCERGLSPEPITAEKRP